MNRAENDVQTICFFWVPLVYPVVWAETPKEVPEWDMSRGCPWHKERPNGDKPHEYRITMDVRNNRVWREHNPEWAKPDWEVKPPPEDGYPRLVRQSLKDRVIPRSRTQHDILGKLAPLYRHFEPWRAGKPVKVLRNEVLELAETYGAPTGRYESITLESWLKVASEVHTHIDTLRSLQLDGNCYELIRDDLLKRKVELDGKRRKLVDEDALREWRLNLAFRDERDAVAKGEHAALAVFCSSIKDTDKRLAEDSEANGTMVFRKAVAQDLYNNGFGATLGRQDEGDKKAFSEYVTFTEFGIRVRCSVSHWVAYKLAELWRHGAQVRLCPVCGTPFAPTRRDTKYCPGGNCADGQYRKTEKGRAAQARRREARKQKTRTK